VDVALGRRRGRHWGDYASAFQAGVAANRVRDWLASAEANRDALLHDPRSADAHLNLGWALAQLGFRELAAREYQQTLALRPGDPRATNNLRLLK
jgi:Flp pilus assembly protein TadD